MSRREQRRSDLLSPLTLVRTREPRMHRQGAQSQNGRGKLSSLLESEPLQLRCVGLGDLCVVKYAFYGPW